MKISYSLGSLLTVDQVLSCADVLSKHNPDTIWIPETWGVENFSMLSAVSNKVKNAKIGSSIINIYSRSPSLIAMGAATIDTISNKRMVLGLGVSSHPIITDFHGYSFEKPLERMREYVKVIKLVLSGKKITHDGKYFSLKDFSLLIKPPRENIPIYLAAINQKMIDLTWEIADGVIFYLRPINELKNKIKEMQNKKIIDVACQLITCMSIDSQEAVDRAKKTLAFYISVGEIYRKFLDSNGFHNEVENIFDEFKKSGLKSNFELVSNSMLESLVICGTPNECVAQFKKFKETGLSSPIIQFNPIGEVSESFKLLTDTFTKELE